MAVSGSAGKESSDTCRFLILSRRMDFFLESAADLRGDLVVVGDHSHARPPWAVALSDGQVVQNLEDHLLIRLTYPG